MTSTPTATIQDAAPVLDAYHTHWKLLVAAPLLAAVAAFGLSFLMKPVFTAKVQIIPPQQQSTGSALMGALTGMASSQLGGIGAIAGLKNPADQWVGMLNSRSIADALVKRFELQQVYETDYVVQARDKLQANSKITAGKDGLISIEIDDVVPTRAQQMADAYVEELNRLTGRLALTEAKQRRIFFEGQLQQTKNNLIAAERSLKQSSVSAALMKITPDSAIADIAQIKSMTTMQEIKLSSMRASLGQQSPEVKQAEIELAALKRQLAQSERPGSDTKNTEADNYIGAYREFKYQEMLFEMLAKQFEIARSDESREGSTLQVIDSAEVPEVKSRPKRAAVAAFAWLATQALLLLALAMRASRPRATSVDGR